MASAGSRRRLRPAAQAWVAAALGVGLIMALAACGSEGDGGDATTLLPSTTMTTEAPVQTTSTSTTEAAPQTTTSTTEAEETTTTASTDPSSTTTTEKLSSAETRLANGHIKVMGFIDRVWEEGGKRYIRIDYAELLTGEEAVAAAIAAGQLAPGEELPNDYFILNQNHTLREYVVSPSVAITTSTWNGEMEAPATWAEFASFWGATPPEGAAHLKDSPWWIERDGPTVLRIDEQYLP